MMPLAAVLHCVVENKIDIQQVCGKDLHGMFFAAVAQAAPDISERLHGNRDLKPFTLALVPTGKKIFKPGEEVKTRFTFLDDTLCLRFVEGAIKEMKHVKLGRYSVAPVFVDLSESPEDSWTGQRTWEELYEEATSDRAIQLFFTTPTTFKQGNMDTPLPIPKLLFQSYIEKWNRFSRIKIDVALLKAIEKYLAPSRYNLHTALFNSGRVQISGFTGKLSLAVVGNPSQEVLRQINCLSDFAFFAGTGRKTTHGMGMTRRIK